MPSEGVRFEIRPRAIGLGTKPSSPTPAPILTLAGLSTVVAGGAAAHRAATTLTIWCWTGADGPLKSVDAGFAKAHPDIELNYVELKPADVYQKLQLAAAAGGGGPDV